MKKFSTSILTGGIVIIWLMVEVWAAEGLTVREGVYNLSSQPVLNVLTVDKSVQRMFVLAGHPDGHVDTLRTFRVSTGRADGDKARRGDLKTPDGIYYVVDQIPDAKLSAKYGPLALVLDYPNYVDRLESRTGSNIWIHGRDEAIVDRQTEGCISLENSHILQLAQYVRIKQTPVIIAEHLQPLSAAELQRQRAVWDSLLRDWAMSWEKGSLDRFFDYYSPSFRDETRQNLNHFKARKRQLEATYSWKRVIVSEAVVLESRPEAHITFQQEYICPKFYSRGQKRLIMIPENSSWRIVREEYTRTAPQIEVDASVAAFLETWRKAWEARATDAYMAHYDTTFSAGNYTWQGWREYKKGVFSQNPQIRVEIKNVRVTSAEPLTWQVRFTQLYTADRHRDKGLKTLILKGVPGAYRISAESWQVQE